MEFVATPCGHVQRFMPHCELTQPILSSQWTAVRAQINTPARTAMPLEQPIVVNEVAGQTEL